MNDWVQIAGWVFLHFLWQGSVLAIVAAGGAAILSPRSSSLRYVVACLALAAMLAAPLLTALRARVRIVARDLRVRIDPCRRRLPDRRTARNIRVPSALLRRCSQRPRA